MDWIFDGVNSIIKEPIGTGDTTFDVQRDIYSAWKRWVQSGNGEYEPAFTVEGGTPIGATGLFTGSTFILINGWKLQAADHDHQVLVVGNIYSDDGIVSTPNPVGNSTLFASGTVGAQGINTGGQIVNAITEQDKIDIANLSVFDGKSVYLDVNHTPNTDYREGSVLNPCTSLADAVTICEALDIRTLKLKSNLTIDQDLAGYEITKADGIVFVTLQGFDTTFTSFTDLVISGQVNGAIRALRCSFLGCTDFQGFYRQCGFTGSYVFAADQTTRFNDCFEGDSTGSFPTFDLTLGTATKFSTHNHSGSFNLTGLNSADKRVEFGLSRGEPILDSSCTDGDFILSGQGKPIVLNGATCNIDITGYTEAGILATNILNYQP